LMQEKGCCAPPAEDRPGRLDHFQLGVRPYFGKVSIGRQLSQILKKRSKKEQLPKLTKRASVPGRTMRCKTQRKCMSGTYVCMGFWMSRMCVYSHREQNNPTHHLVCDHGQSKRCVLVLLQCWLVISGLIV